MIVMKFGGTSVQDAAAMNRVAEIVKSKLGLKPAVVVSAMAKVTDALLGIARVANERRFDQAAKLIGSLADRHLQVARELLNPSNELESVEGAIGEHFAELVGLARSVATLGELTPRSLDAISSFGERLSSLIVAAGFRSRGIPAELIDSRDVLITDRNFTAASPDMRETEKRARARLLPVIADGRVPVAQGFIGSTPEGITTTIGRGGSDYSAAIIGATIGADSIEIWTDVDGLMTADPRIVAGARRIRVVSFAEAAELSYFGARVLHPSTVLPAVERRIPVHIFNTNNPSCEGTLIAAEPKRSQNTIKSIAVKRGVTIINVASTQMIMAHGFLRTIFEVFDRHQTSIDVVTTSETSVSMTLDNTDRLGAILKELNCIGEVNVDPAKAIVCVVGDNLKFTPGVAARLFRALGDINVNMISQGASVINLTFVINDKEIERAIGLLHADFFRECDPAVFA
jgi:aspartate kinase